MVCGGASGAKKTECEHKLSFPGSPYERTAKLNKLLSYRRDTALQGALVLAKRGRLQLGEYITDIIGLSSTTMS